ncbi:MAG: hypothetical protein AB7O80_05450 [Acetobacteraceae bacterium]
MNSGNIAHRFGVAHADRRPDPKPAQAAPLSEDRPATDSAVDDIFLLSPTPQPVWPRVFPGL